MSFKNVLLRGQVLNVIKNLFSWGQVLINWSFLNYRNKLKYNKLSIDWSCQWKIISIHVQQHQSYHTSHARNLLWALSSEIIIVWIVYHCRSTTVMDPCTRATCSSADNLLEWLSLFQLSDSISDTHHGKMNVSISEKDPNGKDVIMHMLCNHFLKLTILSWQETISLLDPIILPIPLLCGFLKMLHSTLLVK